MFGAIFFVSILGITDVTFPTFVYCYLSENITSGLFTVGQSFYGCEWYRLPIDQQKLFNLPLARAQVEFRLKGLDIVDCSLGVFLSVNFRDFFHKEF